MSVTAGSLFMALLELVGYETINDCAIDAVVILSWTALWIVCSSFV